MKNRVLLLLIVALMSFGVTTSLFWVYEAPVNKGITDFFDVVWWWVVTSATVGYGDVVPATYQGRLIAMVAIVTGFFIYTNLVAIVAETAQGYLERRTRGKAPVRAKDHVLLCEYTAIADELIQSISEIPELAGRAVVIVSDLVATNPYPEHQFVHGVPISPASLTQANVREAAYVFVFANLRFGDPDVKTMHVASRVLKLNPRAQVFVELIKPDNELISCLPGRVFVMDSRKLIEDVLRHKRISIPALQAGA